MTKRFKLAGKDLKPLVTGRGGCLASDGIVVDGGRVGVMIREATVRANDSGWRFEAAGESSTDLADPNKWGVYDINTIANYDPAIIEHLDEPAGSVCVLDVDGSLKRLPEPASKAFLPSAK